MAAKSPLKKGEAGAALVAEATRAAAAGGEDEEGRGPLGEDAGAALVAGATCAAAANVHSAWANHNAGVCGQKGESLTVP